MHPVRAGDAVRVVSTKWDGSPHYEYEARFVERSDGLVRLLVAAGTPYAGYRGDGVVTMPYVALFWTNRDYNVFINERPAGRRGIVVYANVALPASLDGGSLRWADLDLDVLTDAGGRVTVDDQDEFEEHRRRLGYPAGVVERALAARDELVRLAEAREFPFDGAR